MVRSNKKEDYVYDFSSSSSFSDDDDDSDFMDTGPYKRKKKLVDSNSDESEPAPKKRKVMVRKKGNVSAGRKVSSASQDVSNNNQKNNTKPLLVLREAFARNPQCPEATDKRMDELREKTNMPSNVIQYWFRLERKKHGDPLPSSNSPRKSSEAHGETEKTKKEKEENGAVDGNSKPIDSSRKFKKEECVASTSHHSESEYDYSDENVEENESEIGKKEQPQRTFSRKPIVENRRCVENEVLFEEFQKDPTYPWRKSDRMKELCEKTGIETKQIQAWFQYRRNKPEKRKEPRNSDPEKAQWEEQKKVLLEYFARDPSTPLFGTERMSELRTATGLIPGKIQSYFQFQQRVAKRNAPSGSGSSKVNVETVKEKDVQNTNKGTKRKREHHQNTREQRNLLREAFDQDQTMPATNSSRLDELCRTTGLDGKHIRDWFQTARKMNGVTNGRGFLKTPEQVNILMAAYAKNSNYPPPGSDRMNELVEATKLEPRRVSSWFRDRQKREKKNGVLVEPVEDGKKDKSKWFQRTPEQTEILLDAYEQDPILPNINCARAKELSAATGLDVGKVSVWFYSHRKTMEALMQTEKGRKTIAKKEEWRKQTKILLDAFRKDPSYVTKNSDRMEELCAATGLKPIAVKQWFINHRIGERRRAERQREEQCRVNAASCGSEEAVLDMVGGSTVPNQTMKTESEEMKEEV